MAALLYDKEQKKFINADQKEVISSTVGIDSNVAEKNVVEVARYAADGKRIAHAQKGLNIVRMSDGSVRKFMVK